MHTQNDLFGQAAQTASRAHPPQASHRQGLSYKAAMSCRRSTPTGFTLGRTRSAQKTHRDTVLRMYIAGLRRGNVFLSARAYTHDVHITPCRACMRRTRASASWVQMWPSSVQLEAHHCTCNFQAQTFSGSPEASEELKSSTQPCTSQGFGCRQHLPVP